jgi:hypothetical protein
VAKKSRLPKYNSGFSFQVLLLATLFIAIFITMFALLRGTQAQRASAANNTQESAQEMEVYYYFEE